MSSVTLHYAGSLHGTTESIAGIARSGVRRMSHASRPEMDIVLDNHYEGKSYSTFDAIKGRVEIAAPHDTRFDEVAITFEGSTKTYVENLSPSATRSRTTAVHKFLKLVMPVRDSDYPQPRIAEAGETYKFDFNFAIPEHLLPRACSHSCSSSHVHHAHVSVPPSVGDREVAGQDDLTPDMVKITYAVTVKVLQHRERDGQDIVLVEGSRKLHVIPAIPEAPPLSLGEGFEDYVVSKTKSLKKGMFSGRLGHITVSAAQPSALVLPAPSAKNTTSPTTMATVKLRFDPHDATLQPPRLGGLNTKIKSTTFYSARPAHNLPSHFNMVSQYETTRGCYDTSISLSSRCVESVAWKRHEPRQMAERRGSDSSTSSSDFSDSALAPEQKPGHPFYTANVIVPITLPTNKTWIPSFHSCIVSRVYAIDLSLSVHTPGTGVPATLVNLHLPVQIASNGNLTGLAQLTAAEAAAELADANAFMQPRVIEVPNEEHVGNSVLVPSPTPAASGSAPEHPPSYEDFIAQPSAISQPVRC
ncbi:hypothetical protein D0Z07_2066 [Hyphodiscus hymeniophilus]|uniref:Arrestin-like N-terminal domain-containing protein n=1 Tax=Hyphodiscus hymeniophilus TaxID=353542 RepID=A0A9P6VQD1_9HELO|nr:hypothetical protein D0Z07_2066 [Hyphodiscus hymeniophilus]